MPCLPAPPGILRAEERELLTIGILKKRPEYTGRFFNWTGSNRPEIIRAVPAKVIASYLGVTPQYLCRLKEELLNE